MAESYPRLIVFFMELPEAVPIPHESTYTFQLEDRVEVLDGLGWQATPDRSIMDSENDFRQFVSFKFWQSITNESFSFGQNVMKVVRQVISPDALSMPVEISENQRVEPPVGSYSTVVEAVTILVSEDLDEAVSLAFDRCIKELDSLIRAYRLSSGNIMGSINLERLPFFILYATRSIDGVWDSGPSILLLNNNLPIRIPPNIMEKADMETMNTWMSNMMRGHPMVAYIEQGIHARWLFEKHGDYQGAVIHEHIASEALFDAALMLMLWEEGVNPSDAARQYFDRSSIVSRVRSDFEPRLGGSWSTDRPGPIANWRNDLGKLRNQIVHSSYRPTREEVVRSLQVVRPVSDYLRSRLVEKRVKYKRTTLLILGIPGLVKRDAWNGQIKSFAEKSNEEPDWVVSFANWRRIMDQART